MFARSQKISELTGADCFILALSRMMKRDGHHGLVGQTQVSLEGIPDMDSLRNGIRSFGEAHPLLDAFVRRSPFTLVPSWWVKENRHGNLPLNLWREKGSPAEEPAGAIDVESAHDLAEELLNRPLDGQGGLRNLRLDLVLLRNGGSLLLLTWNHLLFDGKGAELLVVSLLNSIQGKQPAPHRAPIEATIPLSMQFKKARPAVDRFFSLVSNKYQSLSGKERKRGKLRYKLLRFNQEETHCITQRSVSLSGLFTVSFYLACAARAHRQAFLSRGEDPTHYVSSIPVQLRRKGGQGDPFQNRVTVLFFSLKREELGTMQDAVQSAQKQFEEMTRLELGPSFSMILRLMRRLPSLFYMKFLGTQFSGDITSFFHSATGAFAPHPENLCGAKVIDAFHVPSVSAPPGSGLFFGESHGQLTVTFSWREGAVTEAEADLILSRASEDLTGVGASGES